jgi:hypothetical protein
MGDGGGVDVIVGTFVVMGEGVASRASDARVGRDDVIADDGATVAIAAGLLEAEHAATRLMLSSTAAGRPRARSIAAPPAIDARSRRDP